MEVMEIFLYIILGSMCFTVVFSILVLLFFAIFWIKEMIKDYKDK